MSTLIDEIGAQLPTGVSHEITAAKLRMVLTDMVNAISAPGTSGGGTADRYITSSTTASPGDVCYCNTSAGGFTVTLPTSPSPGTGIGFRDAESSWAAANLIVFPGNNNIENTSGNLVCDVTNGNFDLVWSGASSGWQLIPAIAFAGTSSAGGGSGSTYFHVTSNQNVAAGGTYYCDTVGGSITVTLPSGPSLGQGISFKDASGTWGTSNLNIDPGTNPINGVVATLGVDQSDINFDLVWRGTPTGWQVEIPVTNAARGVVGSAGFLTTKPLGALGQTLTATHGGNVAWNPSDKHSNVALSNGNLTATATASASSLSLNATSVRANTPGSSGRYFEVVWATGGTPDGIALSTSSQVLNFYPGDPNSVSFFANGYVEWPGSGTSNNWGGTWAIGDVIGLYLGSSNIQLIKNGSVAYTVSVLPSGPLYPLLALQNAGENATANFGATAMAFLPAGATSWDGSRTSSGSATWNASDLNGVTLSNGNLTATGTGTGGGQVRATRAGTASRYYEAHIDVDPRSGSIYVGLANSSQSISSGYATDPNGICYFDNGFAAWPGTPTIGNGAVYTVGDTIGVELLTSSAQFYKNGALQFTASPLPPGPLFPIVGVYDATSALTANFGATSFAHLPSGAVAWNT